MMRKWLWKNKIDSHSGQHSIGRYQRESTFCLQKFTFIIFIIFSTTYISLNNIKNENWIWLTTVKIHVEFYRCLYIINAAEKKLLLNLKEAEEAVKAGEGWLELDEFKALVGASIITINRIQHASLRCGPRWVF